jgi:hypothetical protein
MLKKWHPGLNPEKEIVRFRHLWVLMPSCPLVFWILEAFKEIGNAIGKFVYIDPQLLTGSDRRVGRLLVEVDIFGGLMEEIDIEWHGGRFPAEDGLFRVPFRCTNCWENGHLRMQCKKE